MKTKKTILLCLCLVMSLCVMGHRQGIKRPTCEFCGLLKAKCQYHGDHPCGQCGQKFSTQSQMAEHIAKAHPAPPAPTFNCNQCGQKFNTQAQLNSHKAKAHAAPKPQELRTESFTVNGVSFKMCYVKGGTFLMGAASGSDAESYEKPAHRVTLSDYYIGQTEVTQALWQAVMGSNPSKWKGDNLPVEQVSWNDCQTFIENLNAKTGRTFRLPTEAEWEFAARGGNNSRGYKYSGGNLIGNVAWCVVNSDSKTYAVATKQANELGIYDMSGNVCEWCYDWFGENYYKDSDSNNPRGASTGSLRVGRGGSWLDSARFCRVSTRYYFEPYYTGWRLGLRLALLP